MNQAITILSVFIGCCSNILFLELLISEYPGAGHIITLAQFALIVIHGLIFTSNFCRQRNVIPLKEYTVIVVLFFIVNVTNNNAFNYRISMPLHIIFRSGGLVTNMLLGVIILKKSYSASKYVSILMISIGFVLCSYASAISIKRDDFDEDSVNSDFSTWICGIFLLSFALLLSARMGIYQEQMFTKYGKHPKEALFYIHLLSLPGFVLSWRDIYGHVLLFNMSPPLNMLSSVPLVWCLPKAWLFLLANAITQFVCISSVFKLSSECSSLTVTLVLTLKKFASLLLSIFYFNNSFSSLHWIGTVLVFVGTLVFSELKEKLKMKIT